MDPGSYWHCSRLQTTPAAKILGLPGIPKTVPTSIARNFRFTSFLPGVQFVLASTGLRYFVAIPEVLMNVHISYRLHKTPAVEKDIQHQIEKLRKRLRSFAPN